MKILVENFQSISKAVLDATGLTCVVGPSDRGKSALIRAIEGAVFNKTGDFFIKQGAKQTRVQLELDSWVVQWDKGKGVNRFTLKTYGAAPQVFDKVGREAPPPLRGNLGFREITLGARQKDDGSLEGGEVLRPQVAHQWESPFLLDRPGSLLNELMVRVSRLGVLQRAGRQCSLDLRQQRSVLAVRDGDIATAEAALQELAPVVALRDRVTALRADVQKVQALTERLTQLRALQQQRARLLEAVAIPLPAHVTIPEAATQALQTVDTLRTLRTRWLQLQDLPTLPKPTQVKKSDATAYQKWAALAPLRQQRLTAHAEVTVAQSAVTLAANAYHAATTEVAMFKTAHPTCPVCERPW